MADFNKVGLLIMSSDNTKFLVCKKNKSEVTQQYIMPGGKIEDGELELKALVREINEELSCRIEMTSLDYIEEYLDKAAGYFDKTVSIKLYKGTIIGEPIPSNEIESLFWIGKEDMANENVSEIIRNKIIPDLIEKGILKNTLLNNYNPETIDDQHELFWHVDEYDNVIGSVPRKSAHDQTVFPWHRSVHVYLFDNHGNLYFSQRSLKKDTGAGLWTASAGGHIKYGDDPFFTANSEITEELGINCELELLDKLSIDYGTEREIISIFVGIISNPIFNINYDEIQQITGFEYHDIIRKFRKKEFSLSGGSNNTLLHIIENGKLEKFYKKNFQ